MVPDLQKGGLSYNSARRRRKILRISSVLHDGKHVKNTFSSVLGRRRRQNFSPAALKQSILVHFYCFKSPPQAKKNWGILGFLRIPLFIRIPPYLSRIFSRGGGILKFNTPDVSHEIKTRDVMKFRSYGAQIESDVALGQRQNERTSELVSEISTSKLH